MGAFPPPLWPTQPQPWWFLNLQESWPKGHPWHHWEAKVFSVHDRGSTIRKMVLEGYQRPHSFIHQTENWVYSHCILSAKSLFTYHWRHLTSSSLHQSWHAHTVEQTSRGKIAWNYSGEKEAFNAKTLESKRSLWIKGIGVARKIFRNGIKTETTFHFRGFSRKKQRYESRSTF